MRPRVDGRLSLELAWPACRGWGGLTGGGGAVAGEGGEDAGRYAGRGGMWGGEGACVVESAQVEVGGDALVRHVISSDGEEHRAQVGDGLDEEAGELEDDPLEDGRAAPDGPGGGVGVGVRVKVEGDGEGGG